MRHPAKLLRLATLAALLLPTVDVAASQKPGFFEETGFLLAQTEPTDNVLLEVEGVLEEGDTVLDDGSIADAHLFEGQSGQFISISISLKSDDFDTEVSLIRRNGTGDVEIIAENNNISSSNTNSQLLVRLPINDNYLVAVITSSSAGRGRYQLTVTDATEEEAKQIEADQLLQQGNELYEINQFQESLQSWQQALSIYQLLGDRVGEANTRGNIGNINRLRGNYREALDDYEQSLIFFRELNNSDGEAITLGNIGIIHESQGNYSAALKCYMQALVIFRESDNPNGEAAALMNIGNIHLSLGSHPEALNYYSQALSLQRELKDRRGEAITLGNSNRP